RSCGGRLALDLGPAVLIAGKPQAAVPLPACGEAGLLLERVVKRDRVAEQLGDVCARAQLSDEAGGVPGRAASELPALEQKHVGDAHFAEMIGHGAADDAAADNDDLGGRRQRAHARSIASQVAYAVSKRRKFSA